MESKTFNCPKCSGKMVEGFIADKSEAHYFPTFWIEGEPENATFLGITGNNLNVQNRKKFMLRSLRCEKCGFTELYAV